MKTNYLLPNKYKTLGWVLFSIGIIAGIIQVFSGYESYALTTKVFAIYGDPFIGESSFFTVIYNSIVDELTTLIIIIGGLIIGFTKEKIEDEFIYKLRTESLVWAIIFNYAVLAFTVIFVYDLAFFHILVFNMFTPLIFFIIRFNFLKLKSRSHEE